MVNSIAKDAVEAVRQFICEALACDFREPISRDEGLHAEVTFMSYGMVQNKVPKHLVHSIVKGAVEAARQLISEALQCELREPIVRDEGLHTVVAGMIYGMVQNKLPEHLGHSIVREQWRPRRSSLAKPCRAT